MRLTNLKEIKEFRKAIEKCEGSVWLEDAEGSKLNLRSMMSQYIALGALLEDRGESLELFCSLPADEQHFLKFFKENPNAL